MKRIDRSDLILYALLAIMLVATGYFAYTTVSLKKELVALSVKAQTTLEEKNAQLKEAQNTIDTLNSTLRSVKDDLANLEEDYERERNKNEEFEDQIRQISKTVGSLDKLSKTDEELLQKYSKVYFLNENYIPAKLRQIDDKYILPGKDPMFFHGDALPFLTRMLDRAKRDGVDLKIVSAYRSFEMQTELKNGYLQTFGSGANAFSADQGYSEHQLGTTVDVTDPDTGGTYVSFEDTQAFAWLQKNAYRYGFILSYPPDNEFYVYEPWHWRFVGRDLAEYLYDEGINFYDMDQRDIDAYLIKIFD